METTSNARRLLAETDLVQGLGIQEVESRLQVGLRLHDVGHRILAFYLADMDARDLHQALGFSTLLHYARERLGLAKRRFYELLRAGQKLLELPAIDRAFAEQRIGWSKVQLLVKVATPEHEEAWLERALALTVRELEREIGRSKEGQAPRKPGDQRGLSHIAFSVGAKVSPLTLGKWEKAKAKLSAELGQALSNAEVFDLMAEMCLDTDADGTIPGRTPAKGSLFKILLHDKGGEHLEVDSDLGLLPVDGCASLRCDADEQTSSTMRKKVRALDGEACNCCGGRHGLHVHHIVWRSKGGRTVVENLITLCTRCHGHVHDDLLVVAGSRSAGIEYRDREGRLLHEPGSYVGLDVLLELAAPRRAEDDEAPAEPSPAPVALEDLPEAIDGDWWRAHAHLIRMHSGTGLAWTAGRPRVAHDSPSPTTVTPVPVEEAFAGLVGQDDRIERFQSTAKGCRALGRSFPHTLLSGPPGTGKTTMAKGIARLSGGRLHRTSGPLLQDTRALVRQLAGLEAHDVLFVDEIHAVPQTVLEALYEAMEEQEISLTLHAEARSRTVRFELPSFTLLAATTEDGSLPAPLRNRFGLRESLGFYDTEDLASFVTEAACAQRVDMVPDAAEKIARFSRGVPREAKRLLDRVIVEAAGRGIDAADLELIDEVFAALGFDADGLEPLEQRYLERLQGSDVPIPLARLAEMLGVPTDTLTRTVEPFLFRVGRVRMTPRGRVAGRRPPPWAGSDATAHRQRVGDNLVLVWRAA